MNETDRSLSPLAELGQRLRAERERRGWSLQQVSDRTRITVKHLEGLESGNYAEMPATVYVRGFVRSYSKLVDLDEEAQLQFLDRAGIHGSNVRATMRQKAGPEWSGGAGSSAGRPSSSPVPKWILAMGAIVLVGVVIGLIVKAVGGMFGGSDDEIHPPSPFAMKSAEPEKPEAGDEAGARRRKASPFDESPVSEPVSKPRPKAPSAPASEAGPASANEDDPAPVSEVDPAPAAGVMTKTVTGDSPVAPPTAPTATSATITGAAGGGTPFSRGTAAYRAGRFAEAASLMDEVVAADPSNAKAFEYLGSSRYELGETAAAIAAYEKYVSLAPADTKAKEFLEKLRTR